MGIRSTTWKHSSIHNGGGEPATVRRTGSPWDLRRAVEKHRTVSGPIGRSNRCWPIRSTNASGIYLGTCERRQDQHHPDACQSRRTASQRSSHLARRAVHVRTAGDDHPSAFSQAGPQQFQQQHPALAGPASPARIEAHKDDQAQAVYMSQQQLIPYDRIRDYFWDQCGIQISAGSVFNFNQEAFVLLEPFESFLVRQLVQQPLLHADETGVHINKTLHWLHCLCNEHWTLFFPHAKRGGEAIKAMGVLEHFHDRLGHDHWKTYFQFNCQHFLCNAHHLRELECAWVQDGQRWALKMQLLLMEINDATTQAGGCLGQSAAKKFRRRYLNILTPAQTEGPPTEGTGGRKAQTKSRNLLERLRDFETETLRFMTDPLVPFTNNQCENDLRMTKVQQKISGCFRSFEGAQIFCRVRSYLSTCRKHGVQPTEALQLLFEGRLSEVIPRLE